MIDDPFRFCVYCGADCYEDEPKHGPGCPSVTGLWPVTPETLGMRGPDDTYAYGMVCMDCGSEFRVGDVYAHRRCAENCVEVVCVGCRVLNPESSEAM